MCNSNEAFYSVMGKSHAKLVFRNCQIIAGAKSAKLVEFSYVIRVYYPVLNVYK